MPLRSFGPTLASPRCVWLARRRQPAYVRIVFLADQMRGAHRPHRRRRWQRASDRWAVKPMKHEAAWHASMRNAHNHPPAVTWPGTTISRMRNDDNKYSQWATRNEPWRHRGTVSYVVATPAWRHCVLILLHTCVHAVRAHLMGVSSSVLHHNVTLADCTLRHLR